MTFCFDFIVKWWSCAVSCFIVSIFLGTGPEGVETHMHIGRTQHVCFLCLVQLLYFKVFEFLEGNCSGWIAIDWVEIESAVYSWLLSYCACWPRISQWTSWFGFLIYWCQVCNLNKVCRDLKASLHGLVSLFEPPQKEVALFRNCT